MRFLLHVLLVVTLCCCFCALGCSLRWVKRRRQRQRLAALLAAALLAVAAVVHHARAPRPCPHGSEPVFLSAAVMFRIFDADKEQFTLRDVQEWMAVLRFAGVEHFYIFDQCHNESECQRSLGRYPYNAYVTYRRWPPPSQYSYVHPPHTWEQEDYMRAQQSAYMHAATAFGGCSTWQIVLDIDEYPYSRTDTRAGFLTRVIRRHAGRSGRLDWLFGRHFNAVTQMEIPNNLFMGKPSRPTAPSRIGRNIRRAPTPIGSKFWPIAVAKSNRIVSVTMISSC
jgi:hypothetical protein